MRSGGRWVVKHAGLARRVTRRSARLEALVLVSETDEIRTVLGRVYGLLGLPFRPESTADLPADVPRVINTLSEEMRGRYEAQEGRIGERIMERARSLRGEWRAIPDTDSSP